MVVDIAGDGWFESLPVYIVILVMGEMDGNGTYGIFLRAVQVHFICAGCFGRLLAVPRLISLRLGRIL